MKDRPAARFTSRDNFEASSFGDAPVECCCRPLNATLRTSSSSRVSISKLFRRGRWLVFAAVLTQSITVARAQTFTTSLLVGRSPTALAVNPVTNKTYIADGGGSSVTVINGISNTVSGTVSVGTNPAAIAVNPVTNTVYVANSGGTRVTVINSATDT